MFFLKLYNQIKNYSMDQSTYLLMELIDYRKETCTSIIGVYATREESIEEMNKHAKISENPELELRNPIKYDFEYVDIPKYKNKSISYSDIYKCYRKNKYPTHKGPILESDWIMKYDMSTKTNKDICEKLNQAFGINLSSDLPNPSYSGDKFGIKINTFGIDLYFRSMVEDKEYVKEIATKFFTVLDPEDSDLTSKNFNNGYLGSWIKSIDDEDFTDCLDFDCYDHPVYSYFYVIVKL